MFETPQTLVPSMPLRILQIVPAVSLVYGGPSQMVLGFSAALAAAGAEVTVLTTDANGDVGQAPLEVPRDRPVWQNGYQIRYFHCAPFQRYKFSLGLLRWLSRHAAEFDLAHIHALFSPVSTAAATVARRRGLPYVLRPLGTLDPIDLQKKRRLKQVYGVLWERPNLAGAAAIHFTSQREADISERFGLKTPDLILPLGVTAAFPSVDSTGGQEPQESQHPAIRRQLGIADDTPLLLFLSRLDPKKGLDLLLPALELLLQRGSSFHLGLVGSNSQDPAYEAAIAAQIAASPLAAHTSILGFVEGDRKTALLQAADVFVLPSYYENFGIAVAEAMVSGLPVVISDQVYICDQVIQAEAGWVVPCDVTALADCLEAALQHPAECQRRGDNARRYALHHYGWRAIAHQAIQAYGEILETAPARQA